MEASRSSMLFTNLSSSLENLLLNVFRGEGPSKTFLVIGANAVCALHVVRVRADVVATKLGIILSFFFFSPTRGLPRKLKFGG